MLINEEGIKSGVGENTGTKVSICEWLKVSEWIIKYELNKKIKDNI